MNDFWDTAGMQKQYNVIIESLNEVCRVAGERKHRETTDDKLSGEVKDLTEKMREMRKRFKRTWKENIKRSELNKVIRKRIRNDNVETAKQIIEDCWSTKKARKAIVSNSFMSPNRRSKN